MERLEEMFSTHFLSILAVQIMIGGCTDFKRLFLFYDTWAFDIYR